MTEKNNKDIKTRLIELKFHFIELQYEKCIESYMDIYNSIWKIFSYMSAITAAFLIFSKDFPNIKLPLIFLIASTPLVFWYIGIYLPMNRYGEKRLKLIKDIEKKVQNSIQISKIPDVFYFSRFKESKPFCDAFKDAKNKLNISNYIRVKYIANFIGNILSFLYFFFLIWFIISLIIGNYSFFVDP